MKSRCRSSTGLKLVICDGSFYTLGGGEVVGAGGGGTFGLNWYPLPNDHAGVDINITFYKIKKGKEKEIKIDRKRKDKKKKRKCVCAGGCMCGWVCVDFLCVLFLFFLHIILLLLSDRRYLFI